MSSLNIADLIGIPFVDGGRDPASGLDCWGLGMEIARRRGVTLPDYAISTCFDSAAAFEVVKSKTRIDPWLAVPIAEAVLGDIVVMATNPDMPGVIDHMGTIVGPGLMMHTLVKRNTHVVRLHDPFFGPRVQGAFRWVG